jgi:hypothetical protein
MDLAFNAANDGWAAGHLETTGGGYVPLLMHWNGSQWSSVQTPWATGRSIVLHAVEIDASGRLTVAGLDSDRTRRGVIAVRQGESWEVTNFGTDPRANAVIMDLAPLSEGVMATGFFNRQPSTLLSCAAEALRPVDSTPQPTTGLHDTGTHEEHEEPFDIEVDPDTLNVTPASIPGSIAEDRTEAAGLAGLRAPTWGGAVADFNNDSLDDLFIGRHYQQEGALLLNTERSVFDEAATNVAWQDRHGCAAADIDLDMLADLFCTIGVNKGSSNTPNELVMSISDNGGVPATSKYGVLDGFGRGRDAVFLRLDADAYPDLFVLNEPSRPDGVSTSNRLYQNVNGARFTSAPGWGMDRSVGGSCAAAADLDADHDDELILCTTEMLAGQATGAHVYVNEDGRFTDRTAALGIAPANDRDVAVADFNGDGEPDLAQLSSGRLKVSLAHGAQFTRSFETITTGAVAMAIGDVDGDSLPDIYVARRTAGNAGHLMLLNRASGTSFVAMTIPQPGAGTADDVLALDYDANGRMDFVTLNGWNVSGPVKLTAFYPD